MDYANQFICSQTFNPYNFYSLQQHLHMLQQSNLLLIQKNIQLQKQLVKLKQWKLSTLREQSSTNQPEIATIQQIRIAKRKYNPRRCNLEKKYKCQFQNCPRKYSSRIALNSHLRRKHKLFQY